MSPTALACIIGWPVGASLSPAMHNAAFAAAGLDWRYVPMAVRPESLAEALAMLRRLPVRGVNVTMPHKTAVAPLLNALAEDAASVGAVNTIMVADGRWIGRNTDGRGFLRALGSDAGWTPAGRSALLLGAGGAARAVAVALASAGARVTVAARRAEQAASVAALHDGIAGASWDGPGEADLIVQATPAIEGLPLDRLRFDQDVVAVDLIYGVTATPFLRAARAGGATALDGLGMLVCQAALSFEIWTGLDAPVAAMAEAARTALAKRGLGPTSPG